MSAADAGERRSTFTAEDLAVLRRVDRLTARLAELEGALREIAQFRPYDSTPAGYAGAVEVMRSRARAVLGGVT